MDSVKNLKYHRKIICVSEAPHYGRCKIIQHNLWNETLLESAERQRWRRHMQGNIQLNFRCLDV